MTLSYGAPACRCRGLILYSYYDLFLTTSARDTPYPNRTQAPAELVARRLADLRLLGLELLVSSSPHQHLRHIDRAQCTQLPRYST